MDLVTPKAGAKHELLFNEPPSGSLFLCINRAACDHACLVLFDIKTKDPHRKNQLAKQLPVFWSFYVWVDFLEVGHFF